MRAVDLFCKQGGASRGLANAGLEVVGVDIEPQPYYPFTFYQADALTFPLDDYDFIWASPPCQLWSTASVIHGRSGHVNLIAPLRPRLLASGKPFVIENIRGAPLINPIMLCGTMFGLRVRRHRYFETNPPIWPLMPTCACKGKAGYTASHMRSSSFKHGAKLITVAGHNFHVADARSAMGIRHMTQDGLREAIPPIYAQFIVTEVLKTSQKGGY